MKTTFSTLALLLLLSIKTAAGQTLPGERIFLCTDRTACTATDSVRIDGILMATDTLGGPYSRYVYVELINSHDSLCLQQKLRCEPGGRFHSAFQPLTAWPQGTYRLRAYTRLMRNYPPETFPLLTLRIGNDNIRQPAVSHVVHCYLYPEGGHMVDGLRQSIAIRLTDGNDRPLSRNFTLTDSRQRVLANGTTNASGWQLAAFTPEPGEAYYIKVETENGKETFPVPAPNTVPVVQSALKGNILSYYVHPQLPPKYALYLYHRQLGLQRINLKRNGGKIDVTGLGDGLASLILTDEMGEIASESFQRVGFRQSKKTAAAVADADTGAVLCTFRRAISDTTASLPQAVPALILQTDVASPAPFPKNYGRPGEDSEADLRAWLCSATFCRINLKAAQEGKLTLPYAPETQLTLSGRATYRDGGRPVKDGSVMAYQKSNNAVFTSQTDEMGNFRIPVDDYNDGEEFYLQAYDKKGKAYYCRYEMTEDAPPPLARQQSDFASEAYGGDEAQLNRPGLHGVNRLPEVSVTAKRRMYDQEEKLFYKSTLLTHEDIQSHNLIDFKHVVDYFFKYMYLAKDEEKENIAGIKGELVLNSRRASTLFKNQPIRIILDGTPVTVEQIRYMDMNDMESIEYLSPEEVAKRPVAVGAINGALVMKTRNFKAGTNSVGSKGYTYRPLGLSSLSIEEMNSTEDLNNQSPKGWSYIDTIYKDGSVSSSQIKR